MKEFWDTSVLIEFGKNTSVLKEFGKNTSVLIEFGKNTSVLIERTVSWLFNRIILTVSVGVVDVTV